MKNKFKCRIIGSWNFKCDFDNVKKNVTNILGWNKKINDYEEEVVVHQVCNT